MSKPKAVIFDCWNTLYYATARPSLTDRLAKVIMRKRLTYPLLKRFERSIMLAPESEAEVVARRVLRQMGVPTIKPLVDRTVRVLQSPRDHHKAYRDTLDVLRQLKAEGYKLAIISNTYQLTFEALRRDRQLDELFDTIVPSYEVGVIKPDPAIFELTLKRLGVSADAAVMVGDSLRDDIEGAEGAGLVGIWINRRDQKGTTKYQIDELSELPGLLDRLS